MHHQTLKTKKITEIITKNNNNKYYSVTSIKEMQHTENRTVRRDLCRYSSRLFSCGCLLCICNASIVKRVIKSGAWARIFVSYLVTPSQPVRCSPTGAVVFRCSFNRVQKWRTVCPTSRALQPEQRILYTTRLLSCAATGALKEGMRVFSFLVVKLTLTSLIFLSLLPN